MCCVRGVVEGVAVICRRAPATNASFPVCPRHQSQLAEMQLTSQTRRSQVFSTFVYVDVVQRSFRQTRPNPKVPSAMTQYAPREVSLLYMSYKTALSSVAYGLIDGSCILWDPATLADCEVSLDSGACLHHARVRTTTDAYRELARRSHSPRSALRPTRNSPVHWVRFRG